MGWIPLVIMAASAAAKAIGNKKANDQKKKQMLSEDEAKRKQHGVNEDRRISQLQYLQNGASANGFNDIQITPEMLARREYTGAEPVPPSNSAQLFSDVGDFGGAAAAYMSGHQEQQKQDEERQTIICAVYPQAPGCPGFQQAKKSVVSGQSTIPGSTPTPDFESGH